MCGIVGYSGDKQAAPILLDALEKLEYRGYDSAGLAVCDGEIRVVRSAGRLAVLAEKTQNGQLPKGFCGIGHTRWATHGPPDETNAHPHCSDDLLVAGVHNGVIENHRELRNMLENKGCSFRSQTDTEVAVKLIDCFYRVSRDPIKAIRDAAAEFRGSFAMALLFADCPGKIYAVRRDSPMILGRTDTESFLTSDSAAIAAYTQRIYAMKDGETACLEQGRISVFDAAGKPVRVEYAKIPYCAQGNGKEGFKHYMLKEICEQPRAIRDTLDAWTDRERVRFQPAGLDEDFARNIRSLCIVGCGSAYHAGVAAQYVIELMTELTVRVELASEFRYRRLTLCKRDLVVIISQSGETADSLAALREAKRRGLDTLAIVNVPGSSIAREAKYVLLTAAGPEIAVATTKAYSAQLTVCCLLAVWLAKARGEKDEAACRRLLREMKKLPEQIGQILKKTDEIRKLSELVRKAGNVFFIGRGLDYASALEGCLKLKEVSYIHSEAYAAGELKHGTISLVDPDTLAVVLAAQPELREKTFIGMDEMASRGAKVLLLTDDKKDSAEYGFEIPKTEPCFTPILTAVPLQLLSYFAGVGMGANVDKPRNLAKSVTVE